MSTFASSVLPSFPFKPHFAEGKIPKRGIPVVGQLLVRPESRLYTSNQVLAEGANEELAGSGRTWPPKGSDAFKTDEGHTVDVSQVEAYLGDLSVFRWMNQWELNGMVEPMKDKNMTKILLSASGVDANEQLDIIKPQEKSMVDMVKRFNARRLYGGSVRMTVHGRNLRRMDTFGWCDAFLQIFAYRDDAWVQVYETDHLKKEKSPHWKAVVINVKDLQGDESAAKLGASEDPLLFQVWDWNRFQPPDLIGSFRCSLDDLLMNGTAKAGKSSHHQRFELHYSAILGENKEHIKGDKDILEAAEPAGEVIIKSVKRVRDRGSVLSVSQRRGSMRLRKSLAPAESSNASDTELGEVSSGVETPTRSKSRLTFSRYAWASLV
jgi:hypothetical protein